MAQPRSWLRAALLTALACAPSRASASTPALPADADSLTAGVTEIASAGVPGPLAVFGDHAFAVAVGRDGKSGSLPVAAGAEWEKGRVVALGHGGMLGADPLKDNGTAAFVANSIRWVSRRADTATIRVGVLKNDALAALLKGIGMQVSSLEGDWTAQLPKLDAVVIDSHSLRERDQRALGEFIRKGGGLLTSGLGWGWLQQNRSRSIREHPGNQLLRECGIAWCDGTLTPTGERAFTVSPPSTLDPLLNADRALSALDTALAENAASPPEGTPPSPGAFTPNAALVLRAAAAVAAPDSAFALRAAKTLAANHELAIPREQKPLRARDSAARALVALDSAFEASAPSARASPAAADFPGAVPAEAPRVTRPIEVDRSIPGWHSTGLYAAPGETITVSTPAYGRDYRLRIGCHTDKLWEADAWKRSPDIARSWSLSAAPAPGASGAPPPGTSVANPYGGLIYIEVTHPGQGHDPFTISNAIESPHFVLGTTSDEEWRRSRVAPAPWGELESGKVIVSVPSESLRKLDDPAAVMNFWDRISDAHATLATIPLQPDRPHRFVADRQISNGYMHSGYPIMTHLDAAEAMTSLDKLEHGSWGLLHELGHNHQRPEWTFDGTTEVTCNLFSLHAIDTICKAGGRGHDAVDHPPSVRKYVEGGAKFEEWRKEPFLALQMYIELQKAFGWETFKKVFAEYRALPAPERPKSEEQKRDQWMIRFSRACGHNLGPFFQAWGVPTSDEARDSIAGLPKWMPPGWPDVDPPPVKAGK